MSQPYVGEIRLFGGNFAPAGWSFCNGQLLPISENEVLFQLIGTTYGGDGENTFGLPNLQGRVPLHQGTGGGSTYVMAQAAGTETVTLTTNQIPSHNHPVMITTSGSQATPLNNYFSIGQTTQAGSHIYVAPGAATSLVSSSVTPTGGSQPHENMQPYLCVSFIISLFGVFPSQT